jgi:hypothetical protein
MKEFKKIFNSSLCPELTLFKEEIDKNSKEIFDVSKIHVLFLFKSKSKLI